MNVVMALSGATGLSRRHTRHNALTGSFRSGPSDYDSLIRDRYDGLVQDHLPSDRCVVTV
ncbi:hypothetical protein AS9A_P10014 (plasmid) [Hoyosella subflava DQS3-9A1]|uniref:Uncharacterized protein n=1 Tax=Hoyosella subflava (strain DSM 45089 / JCM 17490 / NBRC 109087 / DQS3-9A1) TaxID=443218 RepID=F6ESB0_HOYSD|nr:hypothetical protein AS9A_P10014 [Hoyosella subflava DQS3-9A1]